MIKKSFVILASALLLTGCSRNNSFSINGILNANEDKYIYIDKIDVNNTQRLDSAKINKNGKFNFNVKSSETDYYQLGFSSAQFVTLLAVPGEKIMIQFKGNNLYSDYTIGGSKGSQQVKMLDSTLLVTKRKLDSLRTEYNSLSGTPQAEIKQPQLENAYSDLIAAQRKYNIAFILGNMSSLASVKAVYQKIDDETYVLYEPRDLQFLKIVTDSLKVYYPESRHTISLIDYFEKELNSFNMEVLAQKAMEKPTLKLDPTLQDINGREVALSSLKGKYVLLSFWSVLSQVCIDENLLLKELYKNYSKKGFEIYQINIDTDESAWKEAVRFDELPWISVKEDTSATLSNTVLYNVQSIPANYLYNKEGEIIGKDLNSAALKIRLQSLLGN